MRSASWRCQSWCLYTYLPRRTQYHPNKQNDFGCWNDGISTGFIRPYSTMDLSFFYYPCTQNLNDYMKKKDKWRMQESNPTLEGMLAKLAIPHFHHL